MARHSNETGSHELPAGDGGKRGWLRPEVRRIDAGAAENGLPAGTPDTGVNFS